VHAPTSESNPIPLACSLPADVPFTHVEQLLEHRFTLRRLRPQRRQIHFYDTFGWSLWFRDEILCREGAKLGLYQRAEGWMQETLGNCMFPLKAAHPRIPDDLPPSPLRVKLAERLGIRGLLPLCGFRETRRGLELLDESRKVVLRLEGVELKSIQGDRRYSLCRFRPLLGYEAEAREAASLLLGGGLLPLMRSPLEQELEALGREPQPYSTMPGFDLKADLTAREAVCHIVQRMLNIAQANEFGIVDDIDTEFLHDYRVCLRVIRSAISLVKEVFPPIQTMRLKRSLGTLASRTNRLRDLDVYLLARDLYLAELPEPLRPGLAQMFKDFRAERERELRAVRRHLQSSTTARSLQWLRTFLQSADTLAHTRYSQSLIGPLVCRQMWKRYRKIRQTAERLHDLSSDAEIHRLRIHCKKLRYMMELFSELFPEAELTPLIKSLKTLQCRLGNFNDASVQQASLLAYFEEAHTRDQSHHGSRLALSIGALVGILYQRQSLERSSISTDLENFCSERSVTSFQALLGRTS